MPIPLQSQIGGEQQFMQAIIDAINAGIRVGMPGIIVSFDPDAVTATVQPAIKGYETDENGTQLSNSLPQLVDVPVSFPRGGGVTLTFPVAPGDECQLIFNDQCIDFWWQNGGEQEAVSYRRHDLSDATAHVGIMSQAKKISGISISAAQLRTDDGAAFIELATGHDITVTTPGKLVASAQGGTEITSPTITLNGNVTINGNLSQGMGAGGGTATMLGPINVTNDVVAGGKSTMLHTHPDPQGGNTGAPN